MRRIRPLLALAAILLAPTVALEATQSPGEIEERTITERGGLDPFDARDESELLEIFSDAERLFASARQADSIEVFGGLIARLEADYRRNTLSVALVDILMMSRAYRAEANFNLGERGSAEADLRALLEMEPGWEIDPDVVSPKLVELFESLRGETVGTLLLQIEPGDAHATIDGRSLESAVGPHPVLAGERTVRVTRAGFEPLELPVQVGAGRTVEVSQALERISAVVRLTAGPPGLEVLVDSLPAQVSRSATPEDAAPGGKTLERLEIEGLEPGRHELSFQLDGFRERRLRVEVEALTDYGLATVVLEPTRGEIRLAGVPDSAGVAVNGEAVSPTLNADGTAKLELPPGSYRLTVEVPGVGAFERSVAVEDRQVSRLAVELEPTLAFLGVLGDDRLAAGALSKMLADSFSALGSWRYGDRFLDLAELEALLGRDADGFRALATERANPDLDWPALRAKATGHGAESLFMLAVLGDDLFATTADLWLWSPAPWPAKPHVRSISITEIGGGLGDLIASFEEPVVKPRARLGMRWIESAAADSPVVSAIVPGGPADAAGVREGETILALAGQPVTDPGQLLAMATGLAPGDEVELQLVGPEGERTLKLTPEESFELASLTAADVVEPVLAARLAIELHRGGPGLPQWVLELQKAALLLRASAYDEAVPLLRMIDAPEGPGLGRSTADYWLGTTLLSLDASTYASAARAALERVLENPEARLGHDDGPLLAPRARIRLDQLERHGL